jgi:hypothetical protein
MSDSRRLLWIPIILFLSLLFCLPREAFSSWPEFPLSSDCFLGGAQGTQTTPSIAFDGTNFLAVWEDERINTQRDILGARVSPQGEILDPIGIPICASQNVQSYVNVAWGGHNYLVVWQDYRNENFTIYGARVSPDGSVLDPGGFFIAGGSEWALYPAVASDGSDFFVVWSYYKKETSYDIYGTRITSEGQVLDPGGILICATYQSEYCPSIAYNGSTYLVVWEHNQG